MIKRKLNKILFLPALVISLFAANSAAQTNISGVVNQYGNCIAFTGPSSLIVNDASVFHAHDTVLIIQMMGSQIDHSNNNNYGNITGLNNTGNFEFNTIDSINPFTNTLFFRCSFSNLYTGATQVVKIPTYANATINATLTAKAWDGTTGGILAIMVQGALTLNADIDVTAKGFRGASPSFTPNHLCPTASPGFLSYSYTSNAIDSAGFKGEGIAGLNPFFSRGRGKNATGGGGGHTYNAAGGGGSCYGNGGKGGTELDSCTGGSIADLGGFGGADLNSQVSGQVKLFLGGGGGAGLFESGTLNDATAGGNGGGIIFIMAGTINGNNKNILANGQSVTGITANESAGGGGGGGCIAVYSPTILSLASIQAKGGNGGSSTSNCRGSGGGGGGGLIAVPNAVSGSISFINGGLHGNIFNLCSAWMGTSGNNGTLINNFIGGLPQCFFDAPVTNNYIYNNQAVCTGEIPSSLTGTSPLGGNNIYNYQWEQSFDGITWDVLPGANGSSLAFTSPLPQTTHFRRIVSSGIEYSVSNEVIVTVVILDVSTTSTPVTCNGLCDGTASAVVSGTAGITYTWSNGNNAPDLYNLCPGTYFITATETNSGCTDTASVFITQPSALSSSISPFTNPACHNSSDGKATVVANGGTSPYTFLWSDGQNTPTANNLPAGSYTISVTDAHGCLTIDTVILFSLTTISNNIIDKYKIICGTDTGFPIIGNIPGGVDTTVAYWWIQSTDTTSNSWVAASTVISGNNSQNYIPPNPGASPMFYLRIAFFNGCVDSSNICKVSVYPGSTALGDNIIGNPLTQIVNFSQIPSTIHGNIITGGIPGDTLQYLWIKSQNATFDLMWVATEGTYNDTNLVFNDGADTSFYYNRFVYYVIVPEMEIACISYSNLARVQLLDSNNISCADTVLCSGTAPSVITGNTGNNYTYQWQEYNGSVWADITGATGIDYQPVSISVTTLFRRIVISGPNTLYSNVITIHILPQILNNSILIAPPNVLSNSSVYVCPGSVVGMGNTINPSGGNGTYSYQWMYSPDNTNWAPAAFGTFSAYQTPAIWDTTYFRRRVISGSCVSQSNAITVIPVNMPSSNNISISNDHICSGANADSITETTNTQGLGLKYSWEMKPASTGTWQLISGATAYNYQPLNLTEITTFHRIVKNDQATPVCTSTSNDITIYLNPSPAYSLSVPATFDTVALGSTSEVIVTLNGTPPYTLTLSGGGQNYNALATGSSELITVTPNQNPTDYTITSLVDGTGCSYSGTSQSVQIYTYLSSSVFAGNDTAFCGNSGQLSALNSASGTNWWTGPSWITFSQPNLPNSLVTSGQYIISQLWWHVQDGLFIDSASVHVKFDEMVSTPDAGTDITLLGQNSVQLNAAIPIPSLSTGIWSVFSGNGIFGNSGDSHTIVSSLQNGENILIWTVTNGACGPLTDTLKITVKDMKIPEGFSPNGDGINDFYEITGIETFDKSELVVFNRWGNVIYRKSNYDNTWNGKGLNGKPLPEDTYFYLLTLNGKETKKGFIVLKR